MTKQRPEHHDIILRALNNFNAPFLEQNNILFGGGTRIALELSDFRLSVDIDFLCPDNKSYRALRDEVELNSLGRILKQDFSYVRGEIKADYNAVRTWIEVEDTVIKLEFVSFSDYKLTKDASNPFSVPSIDRASCFTTKLLSLTDRWNNPPHKDFFDILAMVDHWGDIPEEAWTRANDRYSTRSTLKTLRSSIAKFKNNTQMLLDEAEEMSIDSSYAQKLIKSTLNRVETQILEMSEKQEAIDRASGIKVL